MLARLLAKQEYKDLLGENFVFDEVSMGWSPELRLPVGQIRNAYINMGERRDGKPNQVRMDIKSEGPLDIYSFVQYLKAGKMDLNPMGTKHENQLKWLKALFRHEISKRYINRFNS